MNRQNGFSLVELSIVLVILGLLTGGILGGQSLIHAAELRAVTIEFQQWQTAVNTFKQKYFALPGDFDNAAAFWPDDTADGNGNGRVTNGGADAGEEDEFFLFWQHLALAGLISGEYTGVAGGLGVNHHVLGENAPTSRYSGAGWTAESVTGGHADRFVLDYRNSLLFGAPNSDNTTSEAVLQPEEAWNIDTKLDDGKPGKGSIIGLRIQTCTGAGGNTEYDSDYALSTSSVECALYFRNGM